MTRGTTELDPRCSQHYNLPANGEHVLVFYSAKGTRTKASTHNDGVDGYLTSLTRNKDLRASLGNLADVLHCGADDGSSA